MLLKVASATFPCEKGTAKSTALSRKSLQQHTIPWGFSSFEYHVTPHMISWRLHRLCKAEVQNLGVVVGHVVGHRPAGSLIRRAPVAAGSGAAQVRGQACERAERCGADDAAEGGHDGLTLQEALKLRQHGRHQLQEVADRHRLVRRTCWSGVGCSEGLWVDSLAYPCMNIMPTPLFI